MSENRRLSFRDIRDEMARRIAERVWRPGALIPGEETLAAEFGVARGTVNRALQELAGSGLVERRRKAGTKVALHPVREARFSIPLVQSEIEARGAAYAYTLLNREIVAAPDLVRARMALKADADMLHVRCLHLADRAPWQYEDRWINLDAAPAARVEPFDAIGPNQWLVENAPFSHAEFGFFAAAATEREAGLLQLTPGDPVFVGERLTWLAEKPITLVRMTHPPSHRMVTRI